MLTNIVVLTRSLLQFGFNLRVQKADLVIFGYSEHLRLFSKLVNGKTTQLFDPSYQSRLILLPFIKALVQVVCRQSPHSLTHAYFVNVLKLVKPKVVLTHLDKHTDMWLARRTLSASPIRFGILQNGHRREDQIPQTAMLNYGDVVLCLSEPATHVYSIGAGKARVLPVGSLRSKLANERITPNTKLTKNEQACFVSQWRSGQLISGKVHQNWLNVIDPVENDEVYRTENDNLLRITKDLRRTGLQLHVMGASLSSSGLERDFFCAILGPEGPMWRFRARSEVDSSYERLHDYAVVICVDSTLGYEALAEGHRVMFFEPTDLKKLRLDFGYPNHQNLYRSPLHLRASDENDWEKQVRYVLALADKEYVTLAEEVLGSEVLQSSAQDIRNVISGLFRPI